MTLKNPWQKLIRVLLILLLIIAIGIIGYMAIEGWSFADALYMTIITISTVGYTEVHSLSSAGRIFSIVLIIGGVGGMFYGLTSIVQHFVEGHLINILGRHRMKEKISKLDGHIIICGYGRVGREVAGVFKNEGKKFVVVDHDQEAIERANGDGFLCIQGNATSDDILDEAGINSAKALVVAMGSDADNLYVTLSARVKNPKLFIVARISAEESESKLRRAGADRIISPHRNAGRRMAMLTLRPRVVDFIDTTMRCRGNDVVLENIKVDSASPVLGKMVKETLSYSGATAILAVWKTDDTLLPNPPDDTLLELGDELVIIGSHEQLRTLEGTV